MFSRVVVDSSILFDCCLLFDLLQSMKNSHQTGGQDELIFGKKEPSGMIVTTSGRLMVSRVLLWALVACFPLQASQADDIKGSPVKLESIPATRRVEGRITLEYVDGTQRIKNKLAFTEVTDSSTQRSKVSIGHVSYEPKVYHTRGETVMVLNSASKRCETLPADNRWLLPELDFFLRYSYTEGEIAQGFAKLKKSCNSPLAIPLMHGGDVTPYDHTETHRGVQCSVFRALYRRSKTESPIKFDILMPEITLDANAKMPFFTVRETVEGLSKSDGSLGKFDTVITIDFFFIEAIDKSDPHQLAKLEEELSLPLARGCSEFLKSIVPILPASFQSFMMSYVKASTQALVSLAYDHEFGYLREELHGQSVKIWDLNEDLLYHLDHSMFGKLQSGDDSEASLEPCSVIRFDDTASRAPPRELQPPASGTDVVEPAFKIRDLERPYDRMGDSLDVLAFIGAGSGIYYMGRSSARDLPCLVFETILAKPPKVFTVDLQSDFQATDNYEFIVQYFVFENANRELAGSVATGGAPPIVMERFWPARINLYVRHKETAWVHLHDSLDVQDFHWGLYGWQGKPSELFMMPDCFNNIDEQLKIQLTLDFKQTTPAKRRSILARYKYKLELDLQTDLFKLFEMSRLHLTEYRLTLQKHNILASMVISDRKEDKQLSYFGEGDLPSPDAYRDHKVLLSSSQATASVDNCVMSGSHVNNVAMIVYCPAFADEMRASCTAIFDESEPVVRRTSSRIRNKAGQNKPPPCQVFRLKPSEPPRGATHDVDRFNRLLDGHKFSFSMTDDETSQWGAGYKPSATPNIETIDVVVEDFDVSREQQATVVSNFKFSLTDGAQKDASTTDNEQTVASDRNVRYFPSMDYETFGDCSRMCNLDSSCKSFSYCSIKPVEPTSDDEPKCVLSSLDLRRSNIETQLVHATLDENFQVVVKDSDATKGTPPTSEYKLTFRVGCNIHERDFLSMFTRTEEFLRFNGANAGQFPVVSSATECARRVIELEDSEETHHGATFAYCAHTGACLSDENMFGQFDGVAATSIAEEEDPTKVPREFTCQLFRKRYQTYFHVSSMVVKRAAPLSSGESSEQTQAETGVQPAATILSGGISQYEMSLNTVEECARACWNSFGHVCVSFDFCSPRTCIINSVGDLYGSDSNIRQYDPASVEVETRPGCLAYRRDLKWDQLRRDHLLGKHTALVADVKPDNNSRGGWILNLLLLCAIVVVFDVGLIVGKNFNERWENNNGIRRSMLTESRRNLTQFFRPNNSSTATGSRRSHTTRPNRTSERMSSQSKFNIENEIYEDANAIRLDEIGRNDVGATSETQTDKPDVGVSDQNESGEIVGDLMSREEEPSVVARPTSRRPNYIDVPDLL